MMNSATYVMLVGQTQPVIGLAAKRKEHSTLSALFIQTARSI